MTGYNQAEGIAVGKAEVARNLLAMNMPVEIIAQAVQMPVESINALAAAEAATANRLDTHQ